MIKTLFLLLLLVLLFLLRRALAPLFLAVTMAYMLDPFVSRLQKKIKTGRGPAILFAYLIVIASILLLIWGFADLVTGEFASGTLADSLSVLKSYYREYGSTVEQLFHVSFSQEDMGRLIKKLSRLALNLLKSYYREYGSTVERLFHISFGQEDMGRLIKKLSRLALNLLIGAVMSIYLLKDKAFFLRLVTKAFHLLLPQKVHGFLREILFDMDVVLSSFLRGVFVDSVIVAFLSSLALTVLSVDSALFIGLFAGICNVIPYFGPVLGMIPAGLAGAAAGGLSKAALAVFSLLLVQQIECNLIYPKIVGKSTGLHPLFVLIAVSSAGFFGGLFWMVLAVPIAGAVKVLVVKWAENQ